MNKYAELAEKLVRLRAQQAFAIIGSLMFTEPNMRNYLYGLLEKDGRWGFGRVHVTRRLAPEPHLLDLAVAQRDQDPNYAIPEALRLSVDVLMLAARDGLKKVGSPYSPTFEMMRHVRNAVAHGGNFDIRYEGKHAEFAGYAVDQSFDGTPLRDLFMDGDLLALYDAVIDELRAIP